MAEADDFSFRTQISGRAAGHRHRRRQLARCGVEQVAFLLNLQLAPGRDLPANHENRACQNSQHSGQCPGERTQHDGCHRRRNADHDCRLI